MKNGVIYRWQLSLKVLKLRNMLKWCFGESKTIKTINFS